MGGGGHSYIQTYPQKLGREFCAYFFLIILSELTAFLLRLDDVIKRGILTESSKAAREQAEAEGVRLLQTLQGGHNALDKVVSFLPDMVGRFKSLVCDLATVRQRQVDRALSL